MGWPINIKTFEKLLREFPINGKGNAALWEAAGVDMSKFPKTLSEDLRAMQKERLAYLKSKQMSSPVNIITDKNNIDTYFPSKTKDVIGNVHLEDVGNDLGFRWIEKQKSGLGLDPYTAIGTEAARTYADALGKSLISGRELLQPKKTLFHINTYFNTTPLYNHPGKYHETNIHQGVIRDYMENNNLRLPSEEEINFLKNKWLDKGTTASEDGYINVSSLPELFDETGKFRKDLPEEIIDEYSTMLEEGRPGFYQQIIGPIKRPFNDGKFGTIVRTPFIHPYLYEKPNAKFNLGLFSNLYKEGGVLKAQSGLSKLVNTVKSATTKAAEIEKKLKKVETTWQKAVDAGDIATAQKMSDLHFQLKATDNKLLFEQKPLKLYHFSEAKFNQFNPQKFGVNDPGFYGKGIYTSPNRSYASTYGENEYKLYGYAKHPFQTLNNKDRSAAAFSFNRTNESPIIDIDELGFRKELENADAVHQQGVSFARNDKPIEEIVIPKSSQLKLADPITYDDAGNIIPLSKRHDFTNPDIRYGIIPLVGLGLGATATQKEKNGGTIKSIFDETQNN